MPQPRNRIFISIGVSRPGGGLEELPGAITAAERMAGWAKAQNYTTLLLHDGIFPEITVDLLRERITAAIEEVTSQTELQRIVIFFAGHGAALAVGDQYWILSRWPKCTTEAIRVASLQRMLEYYGPRQVAIIGDACQEFSSSFIDLNGSAVLDRPDEEQRPYELDQFFAVDVGKQAFMIKADGDKKDFCLFTEVLLDALEGDVQEDGFEQIGADKVVTSQSLARYLDSNVMREASKYGIRMVPRPRPGFYTDRAYLTLRTPPPTSFPAPPGEQVFSPISKLPDVIFDRDSSAGQITRFPQIPRPEKTPLPRPRSVGKARLIKPRPGKNTRDVQFKAQEKAREASRKTFFDEVAAATVRDHFETGCGICVSGADVAQVTASFGQVSGVDGHPNWFRIDLEDGNADSLDWSDALVTLTDGRMVSVCVVNNFIAALHVIDAGSVSLVHRPIGHFEDEGRHAIDLLAQEHAGLLNREALIRTTALLRDSKPWIITLGCLAAQFYDAVRDVESLRAMAAFHAMHHRPVPLDIVLYGGGRISQSDGRLYADIPPVAARRLGTEQKQEEIFTGDETPGFSRHPIAGRIPWMHQSWGAVATAQCDASAETWRRQALAAMDFLAPGAFSTAVPSGQEAFLALAAITLDQGQAEPMLSS